MKKLILILLIPFITLAQSWTYKEGGNAFDGKYKTSSVLGKGSEFPYNKPSLVINKFDNDEQINFYLNGAGYFQDNTGLSIKWVFDNEPDTIYSSYSWSLSNDGKIIFFNRFNNPLEDATKLEDIDIIEKLTTASKVQLRVSDDYGSNNLIFSLSGSSKAISFVLPKSERENLLAAASKKRDEALSEVNNRKVLYDSILSKLDKEMFEERSLRKLKEKIADDFGFGQYSFSMVDDIVDIEVIGDGVSFKYQREVEVSYIKKDGSKKGVYGNWYVLEDAPVYKRNEQVREKVKSFLAKYEYEKLINHLADEVLKLANGWKGFPISKISDVKIVLSKFEYGKFWNCRVNVYLDDNSVKTIDNTYIYSSGNVQISKNEIKSIGGKQDVEF
jgi:hypothetical protein